MDDRDSARAAIDEDARVVIRCLVAAERAVAEGRFNIAKVLRAVAHAARVRAMNAERGLPAMRSPADALRAERDRARERRRDGAAVGDPALVDILDRAVASLTGHRDVMEEDVSQSLWGCHRCGHVAENDRPDVCSRCGALGAEFEWFGPFYLVTAERLGQLPPEEVAAIVRRTPDNLSDLFAGVPDERLARRPSPSEWSMKEIAGHIVDVTDLFCARVRTMLGTSGTLSIDTPLPPWKLLEGKGYPEMPGTEIVDRIRRVSAEALTLVEGMRATDWGRAALARSRSATILDLGAWLANHNVAHLEQIAALRELEPPA
jgi:rubrerythrin